MGSKSEIVVVGGGIVGAFTAYFLAREGHAVALIDRDAIGSQTSSRNPGGINPMHGTGIPGPMQEFALCCHRLHYEHWTEIGQYSGIDFAPSHPPRIHIALESSDLPFLEKLHKLHNESAGFSAKWLEKDELLALDPRLNASAIRGLWTEGNAKVNARELTRALAAAAIRLGARLVRGEVMGVIQHDDRAIEVKLVSGELPCEAVVLATGPWSDQVKDWTGFHVPLEPVKGELVKVETDGEGVPYSFAWREFSIYGDGGSKVWVGGNEDRSGFDASATEAAMRHILAGVKRMMPRLGIVREVDHIVGFRPMTRDDIPIVGHAPGFANIILALGGGRKGILYGSGMGRAAADLAVHGCSALPIKPCSPVRFSNRCMR